MADTPSYDLPTVPPDPDPNATAPTGAAEFADAEKYLGRTVGGVKLDRLLGAGGMGAVFAGEHERLGKQVAIKILPKGLARERERAERFLREARAAAKLEHPNIVTVYDVGEDDDVWFISMRFVDGESAAGRVRRAGPRPVREVLRITRGVAAALDAAHRRNIIHRDVKPENVLLGEEDEVLLADFGLVRDLDSGTQLSQSGQILGTPAYMSPEQARGEKVDHRSDLYSLGTTAYYLATGLPPFQAETAIATALKHIMDDAVPPSEEQPGIPRAFDTFVERLMAKQPDQRPASAAVVMDEIDALLDGGLDQAPARGGPAVSKGLLAGAAAGIVLLALLGAALSGGSTPAKTRAKNARPETERAPTAPAPKPFPDAEATERTLRTLHDAGKYAEVLALAKRIQGASGVPAGLRAAADRAHDAAMQQLESKRLRNSLGARVLAFKRLVLQGGAGDELSAFVPPNASALDQELVAGLLRLTPGGIDWAGDPEIGAITADPRGHFRTTVILPFRRRANASAGALGWGMEFVHIRGEWYPRFKGTETVVKPALILMMDRLFQATPRDRKQLLEREMDVSLQARDIKPGTPEYRRGHGAMVRGLGLYLAILDRAEEFDYGIEHLQFDEAERIATVGVRLRTKMPRQPLKDATTEYAFKLHHGRWLWWSAENPFARGEGDEGRKPKWGEGRKPGWKKDGKGRPPKDHGGKRGK